MFKKIKKAKKPFSWFLIFCVINFITFSFLFNFEVRLPEIKILYQHPEVKMSFPEVKADFASTTVTVKNAPPTFTSLPKESPTSSTSSPTNIGDYVNFQGTAQDNENNGYYMIICSSNSVIASTTGGAPTCTATTFCVSGLTAHDAQASCSHITTADTFPTEEVQWYAFACDDHSSQGDCSLGSQGNINTDGSPYVVNHGPTFSAVNTTVDNLAPGGTFTFTSTASDPDTKHADTLRIFVCDNPGTTTIAGCSSGQLCTASGAATNISCNFTDTAPTPHNSYTYYAHVFDSWGATSTGNYKSSNYTVINVAPIVGSVTLNGVSNINLNIKGASEVAVTVKADVTDNNQCSDLFQATSTAYLSSVANGANCSASDNDCYQYITTDCGLTLCDGADPADSDSTYTCTTTFAYYTTPTDTGTYVGDSWFAKLTAMDGTLSGSNSYTTPNGREVIAAAALDISQTSIPYGIIKSGQNSGTANATTSVVNYGNTPLNTDVSGTWMRDIGNVYHINEDNQEWSLSAGFNYTTGTNLSSTSPANINVDISRPTSTTDVTDDIYWGIGIPPGQQSGDYYGSTTFIAAVDPSGTW
jgi:hypothetical protein